jgi:predicted nucleic acid-binding protein
MGQVHSARHASGRRVVVKRLRDTLSLDERLAARFHDEGRVSRRVCHPNVVRVFEHGVSADGTPFIVMEHARGVTLRKLILEQGPLSLARIRGLVSQLLDGLAAIHAADVVHADIKSSNIMVDTVGGADHLTIIDFGLARTRTSRAVTADDDVIVGTPEYIAPEVFRGEVPTARADVYSAAIVAYELLVGVTPFGGDTPLDILERHLTEEIVFPADARALISAELEAVLRRALEKDPLRRYPDAQSFAIAFEDAIRALVPDEPQEHDAVPGALPEHEPSGKLETTVVRCRRRELFAALDDGHPDLVIVACLALASALIAENRMFAAVKELEGALVALLPHEGEPPRSLWRIETLLAAMNDRLGNPIRARRAAMDAYDHAVRSGDKLAEQRAGSLMRRLLARRAPANPERGGETDESSQTHLIRRR